VGCKTVCHPTVAAVVVAFLLLVILSVAKNPRILPLPLPFAFAFAFAVAVAVAVASS
jgi:hypothetical protein